MTMTTSLPMTPRRRSSDTLRQKLPALRHAGSLGRCSDSSRFHWLLLSVCILVVPGGTSAMPATTVEGQETPGLDLGALLDAGDGAIVTLVAGTTRLAVHRAVLAARSPGFAAHVPVTSANIEFSLAHMEGPVLRKLVAFMYSGRVPQLPGITPDLLEAATRYAVSGLREAVEEQLSDQLTVDNAAATAVLAATHDFSNLWQAAVAFIRDHGFQVMATPGLAEAVHSHPGAVVKVMRLLSQPTTETSTPDSEGSEATTPTSRPHSDHGTTPAAATTQPPCPDSPPLDEAEVSRLRSLTAKDKVSRLREAAEKGAVQEVRALLAAGVDLEARDGLERTALHFAAYSGHVVATQCLLQAGAEVDSSNKWRLTALHGVVWKGYMEVVRQLLAAGADPNARSIERWTPLHYASRDGRPEVAILLLDAGADRAARTDEGKTPLDIAKEKNYEQLMQILETY